MNFVRQYSLATLFLFILGCQKPADVSPTPPPPPTPIPPSQPKYDSTYLLSSIGGNNAGQAFNFEYDSLNKLTKFYRPYSWGLNSPCYVFYKNGKISYIVGEYGLNTKSSMIFEYGKNNEYIKIYYKYPTTTSTPLDNNAPYFSDWTDGNIHSDCDSVVFANNRIEKVYRIGDMFKHQLYTIIQFYYSDNTDTSLNKLEEYHFDTNGNQFLYDQLLISSDITPCPIKNLLWYFPFVLHLTNDLSSGNGMFLPLLFDDPSSTVKTFLPMVLNRFPKNYKVKNNWGSYNYTGTVFNYHCSPDSLTILGDTPKDPQLNVLYKFKKVRK